MQYLTKLLEGAISRQVSENLRGLKSIERTQFFGNFRIQFELMSRVDLFKGCDEDNCLVPTEVISST